jgi:hypothetical protein
MFSPNIGIANLFKTSQKEMQISEDRKTPIILIKQRENLSKIKDYNFGDITTCRLIYMSIYRRFGEAFSLRLAILTRFHQQVLLVKSDVIKTILIKSCYFKITMKTTSPPC